MPQTHQLAAIMFTDIVGYTALMGNDEHKAFELLNKNRQIHKPLIEQYNGRFIKELGDGEFQNRWGFPDDIGKAVAAIAKGDFPYSTGQVFMIDGSLRIARL